LEQLVEVYLVEMESGIVAVIHGKAIQQFASVLGELDIVQFQ